MLAELSRSTSAANCRTDITRRHRALLTVLRPATIPRDVAVIGAFDAALLHPTRACLGRPLLEVASGRPFEQSPVGGEPGAMQRAIPGLLEVVEAHNAA